MSFQLLYIDKKKKKKGIIWYHSSDYLRLIDDYF